MCGGGGGGGGGCQSRMIETPWRRKEQVRFGQKQEEAATIHQRKLSHLPIQNAGIWRTRGDPGGKGRSLSLL